MDGGLISINYRDSLTKLTREGVSSNLGRTIANGRYRLDLAAPNQYSTLALRLKIYGGDLMKPDSF